MIALRKKQKRYWFKPKVYGYGFYPVTWEGWVATAFLVFLIFVSGVLNGIFVENSTAEGGLSFMLDVFIIAGIATLFFEKKMEEELKWRWGRKRK